MLAKSPDATYQEPLTHVLAATEVIVAGSPIDLSRLLLMTWPLAPRRSGGPPCVFRAKVDF